MRRIGVMYNPFSELSIRVSQEVTEWLQQRGLEVWRGVSQEGREHHDVIGCLDLLIALGGDGTVLRAARLAMDGCEAPVLAVALGRLNFMAELTPDELYDGLAMLLDGGGWYDDRTLIEATVHSDNHPPRKVTALNEVLVARGDINRVISIDVEIYDAKLVTYKADGVVVATATGSTGYALSAGGPIIDPRSRALVLVPIAAHLTNIPSLVLREDVKLKMCVVGRHYAAFSADGREAVPLHEGDSVEVRRSLQTCRFARVHSTSTFYARLAQRLRRE
jgi:NAD+ kinase